MNGKIAQSDLVDSNRIDSAAPGGRQRPGRRPDQRIGMKSEQLQYYRVKYRDIVVSYLPELDGGGHTFGQQYLDVVRSKVGPVGHAFEYCAGPGFIGFSLLAHGLCDRLTLADVNPA